VAGGNFEHLPTGLLAHAFAHHRDSRQGRRGAVDENTRQGGDARSVEVQRLVVEAAGGYKPG
jgi:hypothetical protein